MGLDTTHGCWHGPYSAFNRFRREIAKAAGVPLELMEGYFEWDDRAHGKALEWLAPGEGGPASGSYMGIVLHNFLRDVLPYLPIRWDSLRPDPVLALLDHSDCEGEIAAEDCAPLADRLVELLPLLPEDGPRGLDFRRQTQDFIDGLRLAAENGEAVGFH